jgi:hypothetical protein
VWTELAPWLTPGGLIALTVLSLLRGWVVPGRTLDRLDMEHSRQMAAAERRGDEYQAAWQASDKRADILAAQLEELLVIGRSSAAALTALRQVAVRDGTQP